MGNLINIDTVFIESFVKTIIFDKPTSITVTFCRMSHTAQFHVVLVVTTATDIRFNVTKTFTKILIRSFTVTRNVLHRIRKVVASACAHIDWETQCAGWTTITAKTIVSMHLTKLNAGNIMNFYNENTLAFILN